jgi:predicted enzyme related to lactoylglutathione lyase
VNFNSIMIGTENPRQLVDYYSRLFGDPTWQDGDYTAWRIGSGEVAVAPHSEVSGKSVHPGRIIWNIESADVRADFDRMKGAGAIVVREPYGVEGMEGQIATLADPDGNYFQLVSPMPSDEGSSTGG